MITKIDSLEIIYTFDSMPAVSNYKMNTFILLYNKVVLLNKI